MATFSSSTLREPPPGSPLDERSLPAGPAAGQTGEGALSGRAGRYSSGIATFTRKNRLAAFVGPQPSPPPPIFHQRGGGLQSAVK